MLDIKALEKAFTPKLLSTPIHTQHPLLKIVGASLVIITSMLTTNLILELAILTYISIEITIARIWDRVFFMLRAFRVPFITMTILFLIFYYPQKAIVYALRLVIGSLAVIVIFATTKAMDMSQALENIGLSPKIVKIFELSLRLIPLTARDAIENIEALTLRGKIKSGITGIVDSLAMIISNSLERGEALREALITKFYGVSKRTYPYKVGANIYDFIQLTVKIFLLLVAIQIIM